MNNEEKILSILETLIVKVDKLDAKVYKLDAKVDKLDAKVDKLEQGQAKLEEDVRFVKDCVIIMEHDHKKMLTALSDTDSLHDEELSDIRLRLLRLEQTS